MHITKENYASATGVAEVTVWRRLKGVPFRTPRQRSEKLYPLASVLPTLRDKEIEAGAVERLAHAATRLPNRDMYVEAEALPVAEAFVQFLDRMPWPEPKERGRAVRNQFVVAVANSPICHGPVVANLEALKALFMLHGPVTRWVLLGGRPPDVAGMAVPFAVANNCAELEHISEAVA